jgi:hypothetical protein
VRFNSMEFVLPRRQIGLLQPLNPLSPGCGFAADLVLTPPTPFKGESDGITRPLPTLCTHTAAHPAGSVQPPVTPPVTTAAPCFHRERKPATPLRGPEAAPADFGLI